MNAFLQSIGYNNWILPALLIIPVIGAAILVAMAPRNSDDPVALAAANQTARVIAFVFFLAEFIISAGLWWSFDPSISGWQASVDTSWIPQWGIRFTLG
ncbi:MAG TPA: hypothetical protein VNC11_11705, partial [Gemmatimonadaceae bacterium]|nr:hypothetical protein [Gemmatimonadaceae bacterium]